MNSLSGSLSSSLSAIIGLQYKWLIAQSVNSSPQAWGEYWSNSWNGRIFFENWLAQCFKDWHTWALNSWQSRGTNALKSTAKNWHHLETEFGQTRPQRSQAASFLFSSVFIVLQRQGTCYVHLLLLEGKSYICKRMAELGFKVVFVYLLPSMKTVDTLADNRCRNCCSWCAWVQPNSSDAVFAIANHAPGQPGVPEAHISLSGTEKASEMLWETKNKASLNQNFRRVEWRGALVDLAQKRELQQCHDLFLLIYIKMHIDCLSATVSSHVRGPGACMHSTHAWMQSKQPKIHPQGSGLRGFWFSTHHLGLKQLCSVNSQGANVQYHACIDPIRAFRSSAVMLEWFLQHFISKGGVFCGEKWEHPPPRRRRLVDSGQQT